MAKNKTDYYTLIERQTHYCLEASIIFCEILCNYTALSIPKQSVKLEKFVENSRQLENESLDLLFNEFITPIDKSDILLLIQKIKDITECYKYIIMCFNVFNIIDIPIFAPNISKSIQSSAELLYNIIKELRNFKKSTKLFELISNINKINESAIEEIINAIHVLFSTEVYSKKLLAHKEIYDNLRLCFENSKQITETVKQIILKNI